MQHHESDLDFVLRLLQEEGIPFYFRHDGEGGETLVLAEDAARWDEVAPMEGGAFGVTDAAAHVKRGESVQSFDLCAAIEPTSRTVRDYDFTRPRAMLSLTASHPGAKGARPIYDHPSRLNMHQYSAGSHTHEAHDGARQARIRHEAEHLATRTGRGLGNVTGFAPGAVFEASGHHRSDGDGRFLLTRVERLVQAWGDLPEDVRASEHLSGALREAGVSGREGRESARRYVNHFECIPAAVPFRPARVTPGRWCTGRRRRRWWGLRGRRSTWTSTAASRCSFTGTGRAGRTSTRRAGCARRRTGRGRAGASSSRPASGWRWW